jgi:protein-tyrosine phosphatase
MNILIVCSGNICRSPMADIYLRHRLGLHNSSYTVSSAGTLGIHDDLAASEAVSVVASEAGLDLSAHSTRGVTRESVEEADIILVMEKRHRRYLATLYPGHVKKIHLLSEYVPKGLGLARGDDIFDPVGMEREAFRQCFHLIRSCLDRFAEDLEA